MSSIVRDNLRIKSPHSATYGGKVQVVSIYAYLERKIALKHERVGIFGVHERTWRTSNDEPILDPSFIAFENDPHKQNDDFWPHIDYTAFRYPEAVQLPMTYRWRSSRPE